jgi:hypothetical protein
MLHKLISIAAWATLTFIIFATLSPEQLRPELTATEPATIVVLERVGAFAVLGLLFSGGYPHRYALVWVIVLGSAIRRHLREVLDQPMQDDEVHPPYPVASTGWVSLPMPCAPRGSASPILTGRRMAFDGGSDLTNERRHGAKLQPHPMRSSKGAPVLRPFRCKARSPSQKTS